MRLEIAFIKAYIQCIDIASEGRKTMTTATLARSGAATVTAPARKIAKKESAFSMRDLFDVLSQSLMMARSLPDTGRVSAKDVDKVRAMAESL